MKTEALHVEQKKGKRHFLRAFRMKRIRTSLRQILVSLLLIYLCALAMATDGCMRRNHALWPLAEGSGFLTELAVGALGPRLDPAWRTQWQKWTTQGHGTFNDWLGDPHWYGVFTCAR